MRIYEIIMAILAIAILAFGLTFGMDREIARRDYVKAVSNGDFERPITGCLWEYNCKYYTDMLFDTVD